MGDEITIRRSTEADRTAILRLAQLDSRRQPAGALMLAFVGHELRAALDLDSGAALADPFHRTAELLELLRVTAGQDRERGRLIRAPRLSGLRQAPDAA